MNVFCCTFPCLMACLASPWEQCPIIGTPLVREIGSILWQYWRFIAYFSLVEFFSLSRRTMQTFWCSFLYNDSSFSINYPRFLYFFQINALDVVENIPYSSALSKVYWPPMSQFASKINWSVRHGKTRLASQGECTRLFSVSNTCVINYGKIHFKITCVHV